jgi:hypothetical protein
MRVLEIEEVRVYNKEKHLSPLSKDELWKEHLEPFTVSETK